MAVRRVHAITDKLNISILSLKNWMKKPLPIKEDRMKRPRDREPEERLSARHDNHGWLGEALKAWCRERSLFSHQSVPRQADFCQSGGTGLSREETQSLRILKVENQCLEHGLNHKEKALAEAALPVSQKNYRALLKGEAE